MVLRGAGTAGVPRGPCQQRGAAGPHRQGAHRSRWAGGQAQGPMVRRAPLRQGSAAVHAARHGALQCAYNAEQSPEPKEERARQQGAASGCHPPPGPRNSQHRGLNPGPTPCPLAGPQAWRRTAPLTPLTRAWRWTKPAQRRCLLRPSRSMPRGSTSTCWCVEGALGRVPGVGRWGGP